MTKISDLPRDLAENVFSRLPVTSLRRIRSTCKQWNNFLCKHRSFIKKHLAEAKEFMAVVVVDYRVYLMTYNLLHDPFTSIKAKLISLEDSDRVDISEVYHCDGLLLCVTKDLSRFVVWNPYTSQTWWLKSKSFDHLRLNLYGCAVGYRHRYAIGYEESKSCHNYKILRFIYLAVFGFNEFNEFEIYDLNSNLWKALDVTPNCEIESYAPGVCVSLKGNTYWLARQELIMGVPQVDGFLICFDFTRERFGPRLGLPFHSKIEDTVILSSVREEQLAVLFQLYGTLHMEIWVTDKIEPEVVSWSKIFLLVNMQPLAHISFLIKNASFFIDIEKKLAVVLCKDNFARCTSYIVGEDVHLRKVHLIGSREAYRYHYPLVCSYVPSAVQIKQGSKRKRKRKRQRSLFIN